MIENLTKSSAVHAAEALGLVVTPTNGQDLSRFIAALSTVRCEDVAQIERQIASNGGDMKVTAKEAAAVGAILEEEFGCELLHPSDLATERTCPDTKNPRAISPNGCMDSAEDTTLVGIAKVIMQQIAA